MKALFTLLLATIFAATGYGQTLKALMYNTTNGQVVYNGTNTLTFTNNDIQLGGLILGGATNILGMYDLYAPAAKFEEIQIGGYDLAVDENSNLTLFTSLFFNNTTNAAATRTNLGATTLGSAIFTATNQIAARQALGLQSYTNTLTNSVGTLEIGSTLGPVIVGWTIAPTNATYALRQIVRVPGTSTNTLANNSGTTTETPGTTNDTTWTLTVGDGQGVTNTATTSVLFRNYMIWGRSTNTALDNAALQSLHTSGGQASRAFATSRSRSFSMDGGGQYLYIAYPLSFGSATAGGVTHAMLVDGNVFNNFVVTTNTYINASGHTNSYLIYRTANIINGSGVSFIVQ